MFAPGGMCCPSTLREGDSVSVLADVKGAVLRGTKVGADFLRDGDDDSQFVFVGNGVARMSRDDIFKTNR